MELFAKIFFVVDILVVLKLDRGQISFSLVENALVARPKCLKKRNSISKPQTAKSALDVNLIMVLETHG